MFNKLHKSHAFMFLFYPTHYSASSFKTSEICFLHYTSEWWAIHRWFMIINAYAQCHSPSHLMLLWELEITYHSKSNQQTNWNYEGLHTAVLHCQYPELAFFFFNQPIKLKIIQTMFIICLLYYDKFLSWLPYFFWWHHHPSSHLR